MQGDPKVDELMLPVKAAIQRYIRDTDAFTDIYNRAYEAILNSMEVNKSRAEKAEAELEILKNNMLKEIEHLRGYLKTIEDEAQRKNLDWCRRTAKEALGVKDERT